VEDENFTRQTIPHRFRLRCIQSQHRAADRRAPGKGMGRDTAVRAWQAGRVRWWTPARETGNEVQTTTAEMDEEKSMNEISIVKIEPKAGDIFFVSVHPAMMSAERDHLALQLAKKLHPRLATFIMVSREIAVDQMTGETAKWLADEILKKMPTDKPPEEINP